jgi:hypothetical protein
MKIGGYLLVQGDGRPLEYDTVRCCHCGTHVSIKPHTHGTVYLIPDDRCPDGYREEMGAYCGKCYGPLCLPCDNGTCVPLEQRLAREEAAARRR